MLQQHSNHHLPLLQSRPRNFILIQVIKSFTRNPQFTILIAKQKLPTSFLYLNKCDAHWGEEMFVGVGGTAIIANIIVRTLITMPS